MTKYLIDTHIFLWLIFDPGKISKSNRNVLENSDNEICLSSISLWEISLKYKLGKLDIKGVEPQDLPALAEKMGIALINIDGDSFSSYHKLPIAKNHKDPFDRIVIWYCIYNGFTLLSQDNKFSEYEQFGLRRV